ncbi:histidine phosphatase superfamily [Favolaschia claudopus]|uniref:Histidine phosphatase superfamily n=1 Tax=Favolaschia claudopus TaxID=2862362 RepID=A0AAW0DFX8_9AGAR
MSNVLGVIVIARNGERREFTQDPKSYDPSLTDSTPLGVADLHRLGEQLHATYFTPGSSSFISEISGDVADTEQIKVRAKAGGEGPVVFDSAIALLQGLFPPNPKNKITLANGEVVTAPLGGYQYVPMETVEPGNDRSMEPWTDCPNFQKHVAKFHDSDAFKDMEKEAQPFFKEIKDFVFGRPTTLENIIHDFMHTQLTYNKTYAYRLPPSMINQARTLANFHEDGVFSDPEADGIGNIAGRTLLNTVLKSLGRIAFNDDPLQFMLVQTTYQPFISFFHGTDMVKNDPELKAIPNFGAALAIELRRGGPPDSRDFLRFKFQNGTKEEWKLVHPFGEKSDIALTEFIYRAEGSAITSNKQWAQVCGASSSEASFPSVFPTRETIGRSTIQIAIGSMLFFLMFVLAAFVGRRLRQRKNKYVRLPADEEDAETLEVRTDLPKTTMPVMEKGRVVHFM